MDVRTYRTVTLALRRYFAVTVVDCGTPPGEVARTAMDTAHARVVVAPMTAEGVNGTRQVLDWLAQLPHSALAGTVVALSASSPTPRSTRRRPPRTCERRACPSYRSPTTGIWPREAPSTPRCWAGPPGTPPSASRRRRCTAR